MAFCHNTQGQSSQCYQVPNQTLQTSTYTTDEQFICYHKRHKGKFLHTTCCSFTLIREIWINFRFAYWFFLSALQLLHCISCNVLLPTLCLQCHISMQVSQNSKQNLGCIYVRTSQRTERKSRTFPLLNRFTPTTEHQAEIPTVLFNFHASQGCS